MVIIRVNLPSLMEKTVNIPVLTAHLFDEKIINLFEDARINFQPTQTERIRKLYDIVLSKGDEAFNKFIDCLNHQPWFEIPEMAESYSGRENELEELNNSWKTSQNEKILKISLISGLGGVGKSELCKVFVADLHLQESVNCIWLNSETDDSLFESFKNLAKNIKINIHDQKDISMIIADIVNFFCGKKVVIVFDTLEKITNVFNIVLKEIQKLELLRRNEIKPFVVITTRFGVLKHELSGNVELIELGSLTTIESLTYLAAEFEIEICDQSEILLELARRLQYFPLDLTQAVRFIQSESSKSVILSDHLIGVKEYLERFDKEKEDLLYFHEASFGRLSPCSETTYINWRVVKKILAKHSQIGFICIQLMSAISFFSPDGISVSFLTDITKLYIEWKRYGTFFKFICSICTCLICLNVNVSDAMIQDAISLCSEYSLFSLKNDVIYIHRLVQEVIRVELANMGGLDKKVVSILAYCLKCKFRNKSWPENCIQHAIKVWEHISRDTQLVKRHKFFPGWVFFQLKHDIKYTECCLFGSKAIEVLKSVVGEVDVTFELMHSRCSVLVLNGKYEEAGIGYRALYRKCKSMLGDEHEDTLASEYGIGEVLYHQGKYVEAIDIVMRVVSVQKRVLGKEHSHTLRTKNLIALLLQEQNELNNALLMFRELDAIKVRVFGKEHRDTLVGKNNIGKLLDGQRKYEEALQIFYELDEIQERVLGSGHPCTLMGKFNIAVVHYKKGENSKALSILRDVYEKLKTVLGVDHPDTLLTKTWIDRVDVAVNKIE